MTMYASRADFLRGAAPEGALLRKQYTSAIEKADGRDRARRFVVSTGAVDRDNDSISADGWDLTNFKRNPVVLWAHKYDELPLAKCSDIGVVNGQLVATAEFADHPMADTVLRL